MQCAWIHVVCFNIFIRLSFTLFYFVVAVLQCLRIALGRELNIQPLHTTTYMEV